MKVGDKIRLSSYVMGHRIPGEHEDFIVEEFRFCLGIFSSKDAREAGDFSPLCGLYEPGPESTKHYISNYGEYTSNKVPAFMEIPE